MNVAQFLNSWQFVLLFYICLGLVIFANRRKFEFQAKFIALYRTKLGIKSMQRIAKHEKFVRGWGYVGIVVGYVGMAIISYILLKGFVDLFFIPNAPAVVSPVIPGVQVPGGIKVPLGYGLIALFFVVVIHEFSHGVVSKAHKVPIKSSGFVLFGPLPGAFVEPDEKKLKKKKAVVQNSVFAAGPFSNLITALVFIILFGFTPLLTSQLGYDAPWINKANDVVSVINFAEFTSYIENVSGVEITNIDKGSAADEAGLPNGVIITSIDDVDVRHNLTGFTHVLFNLEAGKPVLLSNDDQTWTIIPQPHEDNETKGFLGIYPRFISEITDRYSAFGLFWRMILVQQVFWIIILSLGLGLANLLPIGPVDGGRMFQIACFRFFGKNKGNVVWNKVGILFILMIVILLFAPILRAMF